MLKALLPTGTDTPHSTVHQPFATGWAAPLTVLFYLVFLHAQSHGGDMGYWTDWTTVLIEDGYDTLQANYPPLLLHWFWLMGQTFSFFGLEYPPKSDAAFKFFALIPVLLSQIWVSIAVEKALIKRQLEPLKNPIFWLTVANPAFLLDGPVWGQVDILPFIPLWFSLLYAHQGRFFAAGVAFAIAIMWKFQSIVMIPVLAGVLLRHWKETPKVIIAIVITGFIGFLPYIVVGKLLDQMAHAYWGNTGMYPYATMNAANFWYLAVGNMTDMHTSLFNGTEGGLFTPHKLGLLSFVAASCLVMFKAWKNDNSHAQLVRLSLVLILCFFAFAPSMHERYMFLLVPFTALACARGYLHGFWFAAATAAVALNILLIVPLEGEMIWELNSVIVVLLALAALIQFGFGKNLTVPSFDRFAKPTATAMVLTFASYHVHQLHLLNIVEFDEFGRCYLSDLSEKAYHQSWGKPRRDTSVTETTISINGRKFEKGLGVHATSRLIYRIPSGAEYFHSFYGMDEEGKKGRVQFSIELDGRTAWRSGEVTYGDAKQISVPLKGARTITLLVEALDSEFADHASWAEASYWQTNPYESISQR